MKAPSAHLHKRPVAVRKRLSGMGRFLLFFGLVFAIWGGMHFFLYLNMREAGIPRAYLLPALWILALTFPLTFFTGRGKKGVLLRFVHRAGNLWMGVSFLLGFWLLVLLVLSEGMALVEHLEIMPPVGQAQLIWGTVGMVALMTLAGLWNAKAGPRVVYYTIDHTPRYRHNRKIKIVQISDVHLGETLEGTYLQRVVNLINREDADLVFITGDFLDRGLKDAGEIIGILKTIRTGIGVFAVTGNHEFYAGVDRFLDIMNKAGIPVLHNEILRTLEGLQIGGIDDRTALVFPASGLTSDLTGALEDLRSDFPSFLLAHQPKDLDAAIEKGVDIIFSGHTHKGQIFPFSLIVRLFFKYLAGPYHLGSYTDLIVSTGTGYWGPPLRILSNSEIVVVDFSY